MYTKNARTTELGNNHPRWSKPLLIWLEIHLCLWICSCSSPIADFENKADREEAPIAEDGGLPEQNSDWFESDVYETHGELVERARQLLATRLGIDGNSAGQKITLESLAAVDWQDNCLDCAQVKELCSLGLTPGFEITFRTDHPDYSDQPFWYHADAPEPHDNLRFCNGIIDNGLQLPGTFLDPHMVVLVENDGISRAKLVLDARQLMARDAAELLLKKGFSLVGTTDGVSTYEIGEPQLYLAGQRILLRPGVHISVYTFGGQSIQVIEIEQLAPDQYRLEANTVNHLQR